MRTNSQPASGKFADTGRKDMLMHLPAGFGLLAHFDFTIAFAWAKWSCAGNVRKRAGNYPDETDKGGLDMIETSKTAPKGDVQGRQVLPDIWIT
jgi:hypothetical protein